MTLPLFATDNRPSLWEYETLAVRRGARAIAGVDEAGRGPLAGPVVAAAVVLPPDVSLPGVNDSKKLSGSQREKLFDLIQKRALAVGVGTADHRTIDRLNILQATLLAMKEAVEKLSHPADFLLVDGISKIPAAFPQLTIKKGDSLSISIAAASIVAKVTRDRLMVSYDQLYPGYGFAAHKGYGSAAHLAAIAALGPCPIHRTTFRGVKEFVGRNGEE